MKTKIYFFIVVSISLFITSNILSQTLKDQILFDSTGNVYVVGQTKCNQDSDLVIIKYNPANGNLIWQKKMGLQGVTFFKAAIIKYGYIFIAALNNFSGNKKIVTVKCDLNGNTSTAI